MQTIRHADITYKFEVLPVEKEEEWAADVRDQAMQEAMASSDGWPLELRAVFLAKVSNEATLAKCGFTAEFGLQNLRTQRGMAKVLQLAASKHHPGVTIEAMLAVVKAKELESARIALTCIPLSPESRAMMLGELDEVEKKVNGRKAGPPPPPLNSDEPSGESPGVSTPIRLAN